ncbi:MAG: hypothetical protein ACC628_18525, partial [Pirellulaceae bacterium]
MPEKVFRLTPERYLEPCSLQDVRAGRGDECSCWIDVDQRESKSLQDLLQSLGLHSLAIEACLEHTPASRLVAYGKSLF